MWKLAHTFGKRTSEVRPVSTLLWRARRLPRGFEERAERRRTASIERRKSALSSELDSRQAARGDDTGADMSNTIRVAWELVGGLRATLLSLEERATRVVPAETAGLIALWTQLHTFDPGVPKTLAWAAWATLVVAMLMLARLVMPSRLSRFWDGLVPPEVVLAELKPIRVDEEAEIAAQLSRALHAQIDRLRRGFQTTVVLTGIALVLTALAYVIDIS